MEGGRELIEEEKGGERAVKGRGKRNRCKKKKEMIDKRLKENYANHVYDEHWMFLLFIVLFNLCICLCPTVCVCHLFIYYQFHSCFLSVMTSPNGTLEDSKWPLLKTTSHHLID